MQAVKRGINSSSPNSGGEVLPLPGVDSLPIDVVSLAADSADFFVGKVDSRKIVEKMDPIEGIHLFRVHLVHGCRRREARGGVDESPGRRSNMCAGVVIVDEAGPKRDIEVLTDLFQALSQLYPCPLKWACCKRSW